MRRSSLSFSAAFHAMVLIFAATSLSFCSKHEFVIPPPIVVDFVDISKVTQTDKPAPQPTPPVKPPEPDKPPPAPANAASQPVQPVKQPPEPPKPEIKPTKADIPDENALPDKKKPPPKKVEPKKAPPRDFSSVLKNLADTKESQATKEAPDLKQNGQATPGQNAPIGEKLTMSEEDALRAQLEKCWNVPIGARDVENMSVDIFMVINPDRTLREARVVDTVRYNSDNFYRAAADSALRAVRSSLCSPFQVPPDKYNTWNTVTVTFNPKDMF